MDTIKHLRYVVFAIILTTAMQMTILELQIFADPPNGQPIHCEQCSRPEDIEILPLNSDDIRIIKESIADKKGIKKIFSKISPLAENAIGIFEGHGITISPFVMKFGGHIGRIYFKNTAGQIAYIDVITKHQGAGLGFRVQLEHMAGVLVAGNDTSRLTLAHLTAETNPLFQASFKLCMLPYCSGRGFSFTNVKGIELRTSFEGIGPSSPVDFSVPSMEINTVNFPDGFNPLHPIRTCLALFKHLFK